MKLISLCATKQTKKEESISKRLHNAVTSKRNNKRQVLIAHTPTRTQTSSQGGRAFSNFEA